jgi:hypothetical protein
MKYKYCEYYVVLSMQEMAFQGLPISNIFCETMTPDPVVMLPLWKTSSPSNKSIQIRPGEINIFKREIDFTCEINVWNWNTSHVFRISHVKLSHVKV